MNHQRHTADAGREAADCAGLGHVGMHDVRLHAMDELDRARERPQIVEWNGKLGRIGSGFMPAAQVKQTLSDWCSTRRKIMLGLHSPLAKMVFEVEACGQEPHGQFVFRGNDGKLFLKITSGLDCLPITQAAQPRRLEGRCQQV